MKKLALLVLALIFVCAAAACSSGNDKITIVLDWAPNTNHAGIYAAQDQGYFAEEGLDVQIIQPPEDGAVPLVANGGAQFGVSFQEQVMQAVCSDNPMPVTTVAAVLQHNTSGIISRGELGVTSPAKLEGLTYASYEMPTELAILKNIVESDGGDYSKINVVPNAATDIVSALSTGTDSVWGYYAWEGVACEVAGLDIDFIPVKDINPVLDFYTPVIISSTDFTKNNPETVRKFVNALARGYTLCATEHKKAVEIMERCVPEIKGKLLEASMEYIAPEFIGDAHQWGEIDTERWDRFNTWMYSNELINKKPVSGEALWSER